MIVRLLVRMAVEHPSLPKYATQTHTDFLLRSFSCCLLRTAQSLDFILEMCVLICVRLFFRRSLLPLSAKCVPHECAVCVCTRVHGQTEWTIMIWEKNIRWRRCIYLCVRVCALSMQRRVKWTTFYSWLYLLIPPCLSVSISLALTHFFPTPSSFSANASDGSMIESENETTPSKVVVIAETDTFRFAAEQQHHNEYRLLCCTYVSCSNHLNRALLLFSIKCA